MASTYPKSHLIILMLLTVVFSTTTGAKIIYVDDDATGSNKGTSWTDAYTFLQEALADARTAEKPVEIRVAQGIYRPNEGLVAIPEFNWRTTTFQLINGVTLKGGYAGSDASDPNDRDIAKYKTILSGDLNDDDGSNFMNNSENSYHVVTGSGTEETAALDGFTVTAGNADGSSIYERGAGIYNNSGNSTLVNCIFSGNLAASYGGGMCNEDNSNPNLTNCTFYRNSANLDGGGAYNYESRPTLIECTFNGNKAHYGGGGMMNFYKGNPILTSCTFSENSAEWGGGMYNSWDCDPVLTKCKFNKNSADDDGGGILNEENSNPTISDCAFIENSANGNKGGGICNLNRSSPSIINCTFVMNSANTGGGVATTFKSNPLLTNCMFSRNRANGGGGMGNLWDCSPTLDNCIFSGNVATYEGGGISNSESTTTLNNCTFVGNSAVDVGGVYNYWDGSSTLINCIVWGNTLPQITVNTVVSYSNIQGGWEGDGNIDIDPQFAELGYWADVNDPNVVVEPNDPNAVWVDGDYHLKSQAGRWDPVSKSWVVDDVTSPCIDAGDPNSPVVDEPAPNGGRINMGVYGGTPQASKSYTEQIVTVQWLGHSTVKIWTDDYIIYVDPQRVSQSLHDADLVCVTHTHSDHYSPSDIAKVSNAQTQFIAPPDVVQLYDSGQAIAPGQTIDLDGVTVIAVPAYNTNKTNHPRSNNWVGYIIELDGRRVYVAGDTELIEEMKSLGHIDVAFLPAGGTYTMNAVEAAEATAYIKPGLAIPYHWGQIVGTLSDAQKFVDLARSPAMVLAVNESISSDNWPEYSPLVAHWQFDETEGDIAHDSVGGNDGTVYGGTWLAARGKIGGALELDGINDYVSIGPVLNPADGTFSVFAWVKGGASGEVIISQTDTNGLTWLGVEPQSGTLMTGLVPTPTGRIITQPLVSKSVINDGAWHHVGFTWDDSFRRLYVDGTEVAVDTGPVALLKSSDGGLNIGAGTNLSQVTFWSGLIDDVRIYWLALTDEEILGVARY